MPKRSAETVGWLNANGEKTGVLKVRLYRPFSVEDFAAVLPKSVKSIAVLDRTKEPGALGEPLYLDVVGALRQADTAGWLKDTHTIRVIGGRYGLGSKEFTPAMIKAVFDELAKPAPKPVFTVGINDDVTGLSLDYDPEFEVVPPGMKQAVFFGLGSDGTVGANKNSIKIIGEGTDNYAQGYFVYDSKKAGAMTVSHLRFGPTPIRSTYLIRSAEFVACHRFDLLHQINVLDYAKPGGIFLLNSPGDPHEAWNNLPREIQEQIILKNLVVLRHRRQHRGPRRRHGRAHQHDHADVLFRHLRRAGEGRSHRRHQIRDQENLWQTRRRGGPAQLRSGGPHLGKPRQDRVSGCAELNASISIRSCRPTRRTSCNASPR